MCRCKLLFMCVLQYFVRLLMHDSHTALKRQPADCSDSMSGKHLEIENLAAKSPCKAILRRSWRSDLKMMIS